jgi:hypothetical protein
VSGHGQGLDGIADRLQTIADDLDQLAFDQLREAAAARSGRPADDKRLMQARRAIEKAIRLLGGDTQDGSADE